MLFHYLVYGTSFLMLVCIPSSLPIRSGWSGDAAPGEMLDSRGEESGNEEGEEDGKGGYGEGEHIEARLRVCG